ncbi:hypothetical protein ACQPZF_05600 [Actinosynnema sp. CS-041913]|uniref:hypothetical protein n=1 Tax=Actinosynnema sp. CS-041913 TaxID=3239917 RepID=UPI003D8EB9B9
MKVNNVFARCVGRRHTTVPLVATLTAAILLSACGDGPSSHADFTANQQLLTTCDPAKPPASLVEIDGTGSSASDAITAERITAVESIATRTAVCSGHLRVLVFSASSAATTVLFDGDLKQLGATDNARLRRVPETVKGVMDTVRSGYRSAMASLPQGASDITAQYRLASEWKQQLGGNSALNLVILTDGFQNVSVDLAAKALSADEAKVLADRVAMPNLAGASVTVAGLGRIAKGAPPSAIVEGLVHYYNALCAKASAATCTSVSDYAEAGR